MKKTAFFALLIMVASFFMTVGLVSAQTAAPIPAGAPATGRAL